MIKILESCLQKVWLLRTATALAFILATSTGIAGCRIQPQTSRYLTPKRSQTITIRSSREYKQAESLYKAGDRLKAYQILVSLKKNEIPLEDVIFLDQQIAIVQGKNPTPIGRQPPVSSLSNISVDCGPRALSIVAKEMGVKADIHSLVKVAGTNEGGTSLEGMRQAAESLGLKAEGVQVDKAALLQLPLPAIAWYDGNHFVALLKVTTNPLTGLSTVIIHDPNDNEEENLPIDALLSRSGGIVLTLKKR